MITVTVWRTPTGFIRRFKALGHAGYAPSGSDIICAAITAITATAIGSLQDIVKLPIRYRLEEGHIECKIPDHLPMTSEQYQKANVIMESMLLGCRQVQQDYGQTYVQVKEKSVHKEGHGHDSC